MPYSTQAGKAWIERLAKRLIKKCQDNSILDVGAGSGTYSDLLRSKLPGTEFTALEVWEPYLSEFHLENKYNAILPIDVRQFTPDTKYGITLLGNVLEYMNKEEAVEVYRKLVAASHFVILSIPLIQYPQDPSRDNPYEKQQKSDWSHEEVLATFDNLVLHRQENEIGIYIGVNPQLHSLQEVIEANKPSIAVYGIYQDEEEVIERFLNSVQTADEIVLCDTGSTDHTNQIINQFKEDHPHVNLKVCSICVSPWRFDDARNTALALVNPDIDLCLSLDMAEYLMEDWQEHLIDQWEFGYTKYSHRYKTILPGEDDLEDWHQQIHIRTGYTWKLPIHEIVEYNKQEKVKKLPDFWVYQKPIQDKVHVNYLPLLEQSVKERKDVWQSWSSLAAEYLLIGKPEAALQALDIALTLHNSDKAYLHQQKYLVYKAQAQTDLALLNLNNAIIHKPDRRELYFEKALYLHQLGRNIEAYFTFQECKKLTHKVTDYHYNSAAWNQEFDQWSTKLLELVKKEGIHFE